MRPLGPSSTLPGLTVKSRTKTVGFASDMCQRSPRRSATCRGLARLRWLVHRAVDVFYPDESRVESEEVQQLVDAISSRESALQTRCATFIQSVARNRLARRQQNALNLQQSRAVVCLQSYGRRMLCVLTRKSRRQCVTLLQRIARGRLVRVRHATVEALLRKRCAILIQSVARCQAVRIRHVAHKLQRVCAAVCLQAHARRMSSSYMASRLRRPIDVSDPHEECRVGTSTAQGYS